MTSYQMQEMYEKDWYQYDVKFNQGFNPLFVPFKYYCKSGTPDPMQNLTFPTLLAIKFDFVDNNISTRHPAFIYQRDKEIQKLTIDDNKAVIRKMAKWRQNIAIGGTIYQSGTMFSGTLKIINKDGILLERQFGKYGYFELMGKMVMAWIELSGVTVTKSLKAELIRPMTSSRHAIKILGESFNVESRSEKQWEIFERILKLDPDFAELRWWYANQKWWQTKNDKWQAEMMVTALESHFVVPSLREAEYNSSEDLKVRFEKIIPNHWVVLLQDYNIIRKKMNYWKARSLVDDAFARPYAYSFSHMVAERLDRNGDYQLSSPLMLSIINSRYNPGSGYISEYQDLVFSFNMLGYLRDSTALIRPMFEFSKDKSIAALYTAYLMDEAMDFKQAIKYFKYASKHSNNKKLSIEFLINTYLDAGLIDGARKIISSEDWNVVSDKVKPVFEGRLSLKAGDLNAAKEKLLSAKNKIKKDNYHRRFLETALFEIQLQKGNKKAAETIERLWINSPRSRKTYHLFKKVYHNNRKKMLAYLRVANYLFPNQVYWQNESKGYLPFPAHDSDYLEKALPKYKKMMKNGELERLSGFEVEDYCMALLKSNPEKYYITVIDLYRRHASSRSKISAYQRAHRKAFLASIIKLAKRLREHKSA